MFESFGPPDKQVPAGHQVKIHIEGLWWEQGPAASFDLVDIVVTWNFIEGFEPIDPLSLQEFFPFVLGFDGDGTESNPLDMWVQFNAALLFGDSCTLDFFCSSPTKVDASDLHVTLAVQHVPVPAAWAMMALPLLLLRRFRR